MQKNKNQDDHPFDDCPICAAMKKAEKKGGNLTEAELKKAFQGAKDKGVFVGGEWFEK